MTQEEVTDVTSEEITNDVNNLLGKVRAFHLSKCLKCHSYMQGCGIIDFEIICSIITELNQKYPVHLSAIALKSILYMEPRLVIMMANGISMSPMIDDGDILCLIHCGKATTNDIICFIPPKENDMQSLICHQIVGIDENFVYAKGTNTDYIEKVKPEAIMAKVAAIIKKDDEKYKYLFDMFSGIYKK